MENNAYEWFETGLSILFNEPEINHGDAGQYAELCFTSIPKIRLKIPNINPNECFLFAHHIWKSSILLSKIILNGEYGINVSGVSCLELGAGTGLVSVVTALKNGKVTASDYPSSIIIENLKCNMKTNLTNIPEWKVIGHEWGGNILREHGETYDYIIMADTLWMKDQHQNLISDIKQFLKPSGAVIGVAGLHTGLTVLNSFFEICKQNGFLVVILDKFLVPIGSGYFENTEWTRTAVISDDVNQRRNYLITFTLTRLNDKN
jgi:SAM-dependent methyltransferase